MFSVFFLFWFVDERFVLQIQPYVRRSDERLHLLCQVEIFLLLLCAYNALHDASFTGPGSTEDITLSAVLITLTAGLFLYFILLAVRFLREEYYALLREVKLDRLVHDTSTGAPDASAAALTDTHADDQSATTNADTSEGDVEMTSAAIPTDGNDEADDPAV